MFFGPLILTLLFSLITGSYIRRMWGTPLFSLLGILLFAWLQPVLTKHNLRRFGIIIGIIFITFLLLYFWDNTFHPYLKQKGKYEIYPGKSIALTLTKEWRARFHTPLKFVAGSRLPVVNIAYYSPDKPDCYFEWNKKNSPWINENDLKKYGALFVWETSDNHITLPKAIKRRFPTAKALHPYYFNWAVRYQTLITTLLSHKKIPPEKLAIAFLPPE